MGEVTDEDEGRPPDQKSSMERKREGDKDSSVEYDGRPGREREREREREEDNDDENSGRFSKTERERENVRSSH